MEFANYVISFLVLFVIATIVTIVAITVYIVPKQPEITDIVISEKRVSIYWEKIHNATSYVVYNVHESNDEKEYELIKKVKNNSITFQGEWDDTYTIVVRAFNRMIPGDYSDSENIVITKPKPGPDMYDVYAFFGSDSRAIGDSWKTDKSTGTEGKPMSDVIMLLRLDRSNKKVDFISVYRDTLLNVDGRGEYNKANIAYAYGGPSQAVDMLEKNLELWIKGYAVANFKTVADIIDEMGGVTIDIENDPVEDAYKSDTIKTVPDVVNRCIDEMNRVYDVSSKHINAGKGQKLNGMQAVSYARVRYSAGSDKQRTVRQRYVLEQMVKKFKALDSETQISVVEKIISTVDTDIDFNELYKDFAYYEIGSNYGFPFYKRDAKFINKQGEMKWAVVPADLERSVTRLHNKVFEESWYEPNKRIKKYSKEIREIRFYNGADKIVKVDFDTRQAEFDDKY